LSPSEEKAGGWGNGEMRKFEDWRIGGLDLRIGGFEDLRI
jgi:hypothetical protein